MQNLCEGHVLRTNTSRIIQTFALSKPLKTPNKILQGHREGGGLNQKKNENDGEHR